MLNLKSPSRKKSVKILTIGNYSVMIVDIIQGLAFVPLYLIYIGERLYGLWLGTGGIISALSFLDLGLATLIIQRISREYGKKDFEGISRFFFGGIIINFSFLTILLILGVLVSYKLNVIFPNVGKQDNEQLVKAFQLAMLALVLLLLNNTIEGTLNALQKPLFGKVVQLTGAVSGLILTFILLHKENPLLAIPLGMLSRAMISLIPNIIYLTLIFTKNRIRLFNIQWKVVKDYLRLTPNLMLSKFGTSLVANIQPTLINIFISPQVAVYYSVTKKAGGLIITVLNRIGGVLYPSMAHLYADKDINQFRTFFIKLFNFIMPVSITLFLAYILLNKPFVTVWVGAQNFLGFGFTLLLAFSLIVSFSSNFLSYLLSTTGDIRFSNNTVFFESLAKVIFLYAFLRVFGITGLPLAIAFTSTIFSLIYLKRWNKHLLLNRVQILSILKKLGAIFLNLIISTIIIYYLIKPIPITNMSSFIFLGLVVSIVLTIVLIFSTPYYKNYLILKFKALHNK